MRIPIAKVGTANVVRDINAHELPPAMWSNVKNMRFKDGALEKFTGHLAVTTPEIPPYWLLPVATDTQLYWLYAGESEVHAWSTTHANITNTGGSYSGTINGWTGGLINGVPVINSGADVPQAWIPVGMGQELTDLANWPVGWLCGALRPFKQFLIAMDVTISSTRYSNMVAWSHPADPGSVPASWDDTDDTKDAGTIPLSETSGRVMDGLTLRDVFMVYKEDSTYVCSFVGGSKVLDFRQLATRAGILARNCAVSYVHQGPKHAVFGVDDCFITDGTNITFIFDKLWKRWIYRQIEPAYYHTCFAAANYSMTEIWFCFPQTGFALPNIAVVWNWVTGQIGARDLPGVSHIASGPVSITDDTWDSDPDHWDEDTSVWGERAFNPTQIKLLMAEPGPGEIPE